MANEKRPWFTYFACFVLGSLVAVTIILVRINNTVDPLDVLEAQAPSVELGEVHDQIVKGDAPYGDGPVDDAMPGDDADIIAVLDSHCESEHSAKARFYSDNITQIDVICASADGVWADVYMPGLQSWGRSDRLAKNWKRVTDSGFDVFDRDMLAACGTLGVYALVNYTATGPPNTSPSRSAFEHQQTWYHGGFPLCFDEAQGVVWIDNTFGINSSIASSAPPNPRFTGMKRVP